MKRIIAVICAVALLACLLCSCGSGETGATTEYNMIYNGTEIKIGEALDVGKLGTPAKVTENDGCAGVGVEREYIYSGLCINTYEDGGRDIIYVITLTDDSVSTPQGIKIGDTSDDIRTAYGDSVTFSDSYATLVSGSTRLTFEIKNGTVSKIQYREA